MLYRLIVSFNIDCKAMTQAKEEETLADVRAHPNVEAVDTPDFNTSILPIIPWVSSSLINADRQLSILYSSNFNCLGILRDIRTWPRSCIAGQRAKVTRHTRALVVAIALPDAQLRHIHFDFGGLLTVSEGFSYRVACADGFSHWPIAIALKDSSA